MLSILKNFILVVITIILTISCKKEETLQKFMVENQERNDIIAFDISSDVLALKENSNNSENAEVLKTIKNASIIAYQIDSTNKTSYNQDVEKLNQVLKNKKYNELMRMGKGQNGVKVYTIGDENALDEVILYAKDEKKGWAIVRVTGKNMSPDKIMSLMNDIQLNDVEQLSKIKDIFK